MMECAGSIRPSGLFFFCLVGVLDEDDYDEQEGENTEKRK